MCITEIVSAILSINPKSALSACIRARPFIVHCSLKKGLPSGNPFPFILREAFILSKAASIRFVLPFP
jgi:hypothetical protein